MDVMSLISKNYEGTLAPSWASSVGVGSRSSLAAFPGGQPLTVQAKRAQLDSP